MAGDWIKVEKCSPDKPEVMPLARLWGSASSKAIPGAWTFMPTLIDVPRRCIFFAPLRSDPDQRTGSQRWPEFMAQYEAVKKERARVRRETGERGIGRARAGLSVQKQDADTIA